MAGGTTQPGKGLFGYRRSVVQQIITDREIVLRQAEGRLHAAESRVAELEGELSELRERGRRTQEQLDRLRALAGDDVVILPESGGSAPAGDDDAHEEEEDVTQDIGSTGGTAPTSPASPSEITARFLTEELAGILTAAEESAARIVERAQTSTEQQIAEANRMWRDVQGEIARFAAWRQEVEPIIDDVRRKVDDVREKVEAVPERIREALAPMADSISAVDADLSHLAATAPPPVLIPPAGLGADPIWVDDGQDAASGAVVGADPGSMGGEDVGTQAAGEPTGAEHPEG